MKHILFFFGLLAGYLISMNNHAHAEKNSYIVALNNAPPYRIVSTVNGVKEFSGIYVDSIKEVARRLNLPLTFYEVPFSRALAMMRLGRADIMIGPNRTEDREAFMHFLSSELPRENKVFYLSPKNDNILHYEDLAGKRIGVLNKAVYFDAFDKDWSLNKIKLPKYENGLKMLMANRLDAVIMPEQLGDYQIRALNLPLKKSGYSIEGRPSYIAVSKKSPLMKEAPRLNRTLSALKADGSFLRILENYR